MVCYRNRFSTLSPLSPFISLPKYFGSEWSYAQYHIPARVSHISLSSASHATNIVEEERCTAAWIYAPLDPTALQNPSHDRDKEEFQIIVLTYSGGWYRLGLPTSSSSASASGSGSAQAHTQTTHTTKSRPASMLGVSPAAQTLRSPSPLSRPRSLSGASMSGRRVDKGKGKEDDRERDKDKDKEAKEGHLCSLLEFRRYGRWDGWG